MTTVEAPPGLAGVIVADTELSDVRGNEGFYHYRGHDAVQLARVRTFEEVWYLVQEGSLPTPEQREAFQREVAAARHVSLSVDTALPAIAAAAAGFDGLAALRTADRKSVV